MKNNPVIIISVLLIVLSSFAGASITPTANNIPTFHDNYKDYPQYLSHGNLKNNAFDCDTSFISFSYPAVESNHANQPNVVRGDAVWRMQGFTRTHLGRCPYSTADNPGIEKWRFSAGDWCDGSPVIGVDGTIYFGSSDSYLYAIYPNGILKWKYDVNDFLGDFGCSPAIADDGTIYIGTTYGSFIKALHPNGTLKWEYWVPDIDTSITLDEGVLYYGHWDGVDARYPNGTLKWRYATQDFVQSTPAVDDNGTVYFGSHDTYVYAVYPNGTLKWRYKTGDWVHGSPTIGYDNTIYIGSDDDYLYAFYPENGTLKWRCLLASGMRASPSLDQEGNLYFGVNKNRIYSVSPAGVIRWEFQIGQYDSVWGSTAAISSDGTVYVGAAKESGSLRGGEIIALDLQGNLKWRKTLCNIGVLYSSPVIAEDGTIYICSSNDLFGTLHAFGPVDTNLPPETPTLQGPSQGKIKENIRFNVSSDDPDNNPVSYYADWGDGTITGWTEDYLPGVTVRLYHRFEKRGQYTVKVKAKDTFGLESDWAILEVTMPKNNALYLNHPILTWLLERFPNLFPLLRYFID